MAMTSEEANALSDLDATKLMLENAELEYELSEDTELSAYEILVEETGVVFHFDVLNKLTNVKMSDS